MRKCLYAFVVFSFTFGFSGCQDFLSEAPNRSGSAYIYHMDQLYGLTGNSLLIRTGFPWSAFVFRGDAVEITPYNVITFGTPPGAAYNIWSWRYEVLTTGNVLPITWNPSWNAIFTYNTVLENLDNVIQTKPLIRKQVEGEALFGRAYFHFILLVEYALWDEDAPGIGYRDNTSPGDIPDRRTVGYTLSRIYQDLDAAEALLRAAGRTVFEPQRNFRPTVPTVQAFRARVDLYRGNYASALQNATAALEAHSYLLDFKNDPRYTMFDLPDVIHFLDADSTVVDTLRPQQLRDVLASGTAGIWQHPEFFLPHFSELWSVVGGRQSVPISQSFYDLFTDKDNDERWLRFYNNHFMVYNRFSRTVTLPGNNTPTTRVFSWQDQQNIPEANRHIYLRFSWGLNDPGMMFILGMTTAEMHLIRAEALARAGNTAEAAEVLRTLRRARFTTEEAANNIGGSIQEVLDERAREMGPLWRFFDIKRLNGAENANIYIRRQILRYPALGMGSLEELVIAPNDGRWALPFHEIQRELMGWEQNALY